MRKFALGLAGLALLSGFGGGAALLFPKPAQASEEAKPAEEGATPEAAVSFVQMSPLVLPIIDKNGVSQIISLVVSLEVKDEPAAKEVERLTPRLKDAYIQDMYGVLTRQAVMEGGVVKVGYIKSRLNKITSEVLGQDKVKDVLLQVVQQRPV